MQQQQQQQQPLVIAYGSETGTAKEVAHYIASRAVRRGLKPWVGALDALPLQLLPSLRASIFVVATTGDGEAPHNMQEAWKVLLRKDLAVNSLADMEFALLALGDSTYAKYCAAARRLDVRLRQLGAKRMIELGYADEQSEEGTWGDVDRWVQGLWAVLEPLSTRLLLGEMNQLSTVHGELEPVQPFKVHAVTREPGTVEGEERFYRVLKPAALVDIDDYVPSMAQVVASRRLTSPDCSQQVQHIELAVEKGYRAGDVAWVHPDNDPVLVGEFAQLLGLSLDEQIEIEKDLVSSSGGGARAQEEEGSLCGLLACHQGDSYGKQSISDLPAVCSIEKLLSRFLDIGGTPRRTFFEQLSQFASDPEEREKLLELSSPAGANLLNDYCRRERRTYVEVLSDFPSARPSLGYLLAMIPRLRPRAFSIASSLLAFPGRVHICVAVVKYRTPYRREKKGVCSSWLAGLSCGSRIPLWITRGSFTLPSSAAHPVILVGPGTGVAPLRSIVQEREVLRKKVESPTEHRAYNPTPDTLFFGCRYSKKDYLYENEWRERVQRGALDLRTAFSRDQLEKIYVQHCIKEEGEKLAKLIMAHGAHIFVSGNAKDMPTDVRSAFRHVLMQHEGMAEGEAEKYLKRMERNKRYCVECWA